MFRININAMKLDEITVTFHPRRPNKPTIIPTDDAHPKSGIITSLIFNLHFHIEEINQMQLKN